MKRTTALVFTLAVLGSLHLAQANPSITVQPASRFNNVGDNAQFFVVATGSGTLSYQWQFNGADMPGATTATNIVPVTDTGKAGTYSVVVTDANGPTPSGGAVLSIPLGNRTKITQWNFNSNPPDTSTSSGVTTPSIGSGTLSTSGASANGFNVGSVSDPAASDNTSRRWNALSPSAANKTAGAQFAVSTVGYKNIAVSGEFWVPARGSGYWRGQYTTNGTDWIDHLLINRRAAFLAGSPDFLYFYDDLSSAEGVKSNVKFAYRVVAEYESTATGAGVDAYVAMDPNQTFPGTGGLFGWDMFTAVGVVDTSADTPVITAQPQSLTNNVGDLAQFSVMASGLGTLRYQWNFAGNAIAGATTSVLNLLVTNASQAGAYTVVVNDDYGSVQSSHAVLFLPAGTRKMLTQWNFNSATPDANVATGVTTPSLGSGAMTLTNVVGNDWNTGSASDPTSLGTDNSGRALQGPSNAAAPNKTGGPQFAVDTTWYKDLIVSCELWVAGRASAYWRGQYTTNGIDWLDRMVIDKRTTYVQVNGATYTFHYDDLTGVEGVDNNPYFAYRFVAEYESTATGAGSDAYVMANPSDPAGFNNTGPFRIDMVSVQGNYLSATPIILGQPRNATAPAGANVAFAVSAIGDNLAYQWRYNGGNLTGATASTLLVTNVQAAKAGSYSVVVSNPNGSTNSANAVLTVIDHQFAAGDRYWAGGPGTWNSSLPYWGLAADGPFDRVWDNTSLDSAIFSANGLQPGAVTLGEAITVNKLTVTNANVTPAYSFNGSTLTFAGANPEVFVEGTTSTSGTNSVTISSKVSSALLTKTGGGRLVFNNTSNTVEKWVVKGGAITSADGVVAIFGSNQPAQLATDFVTLDNGGLGFATASTTESIGANRGLYLGPGGGQLGNSDASAIITLDSPISGPGRLWFASAGYWPGQGQGANGVFILSNANNTYAGDTLITQSEVRCGTNYVFPATTTLVISNDAVHGRVNLNGTHQTVAKVILDSRAGSSRIFDSVGGGTLTAAEFELRRTGYTGDSVSAVLAGSGVLKKTTTGNISISSANTYSGATYHQGGTIQLNGVGRFGNGAGTLYLQGNEGTVVIAVNQTRTTDTLLQNPVVMTALEAQLQSTLGATGEILFLNGGPWDVQSGTLYLVNPSTNAGSTFILGLTNTAAFSSAAQLSLWSESVGLASLNPVGSEQVFDSVISGAGSFRRSVLSGAGGRTIFTADNSYSGGTLVEAGTLLVNNPYGSGTGGGAVTVGAPAGVVGGTGSVGGLVTVTNGGGISAGDTVGVLTLQNGLDLSNGGANIWDLAALKDNSTGVPGTDFDQLVLSGGELQLGGSSSLVLRFASGVAPSSALPFWQAARTWRIVSLNGGQNTANAAFASIVNGSYSAGNFSTSVDGSGNLVLTFTPNAPAAPHVTTHPLSRTNIVGTIASFSVVATGSDPLTYAWFRSTAPFTPIAGATNATYSIPNVQSANAGDYFARVYNGLGNDTSQTATLTVAPQPQVQSPVVSGGNVTLTWPAVLGTAYQVQYSTNLATATWYTLTNAMASGLTLSVSDHPSVGSPQRFYRLLVQ